MKVSFDNTKVAFANKTDFDLKKGYWLFKLVSSPTLVKLGKYSVNLALALRIPIGWALKKNIFSQFCGGETIEECASTTRVLDQLNVGTILDYSVEGKDSIEDLENTSEEILETVNTANNNLHIPFCVFKVTGVARFGLLQKVNEQKTLTSEEQQEFKAVLARVDRIAKHAFETGTPVFIDAEESWVQDAIDTLTHDLMEKYNKEKVIVYNTAQMYRHDRLAFLQKMFAEAKTKGYHYGVKLVRGAYMEKERERAKERNYPSPIQPDKASSDRDFDAALELCLKNIDHTALVAGSHNEKSTLVLIDLMSKHGVVPSDPRIYFAQLFGMSDHISFNLSHAGFNVAKYVPYGPISEVIPYLIRRANENTSVKGQTGRELSLIMKELTRRKES
ncbi:MAG: proline dehydrogenase [Flavobacteriales bacterium]|jgi:proline dehydrogenase